MTHIRIDLDTEAATATDAAHLRALADVIDPPKPLVTLAPCAPTPERFVYARRADGMKGIYDRERNLFGPAISRHYLAAFRSGEESTDGWAWDSEPSIEVIA